MKMDYNQEVTADSVQTHWLGFVQFHEFGGTALVEKVIVEQENNSDAEWNINANGSAIFSSTQSVASGDTPETFVPDQNRELTGANSELQFDVTASASFADQIRVGVLLTDNVE